MQQTPPPLAPSQIILSCIFHHIEGFCPSSDSSERFQTFVKSIDWRLPAVVWDWTAPYVGAVSNAPPMHTYLAHTRSLSPPSCPQATPAARPAQARPAGAARGLRPRRLRVGGAGARRLLPRARVRRLQVDGVAHPQQVRAQVLCEQVRALDGLHGGREL